MGRGLSGASETQKPLSILPPSSSKCFGVMFRRSMVKKFLQSSPQRRTSRGSKQGSGRRNAAEHASHGVFDGMPARLLRTGKCGYTGERLASKAALHPGDHMPLRVTACAIDQRTTDHDVPVVLLQQSVLG